MSNHFMAQILLSLSLYPLFKANRTCFNQPEYARVRVSAPGLFFMFTNVIRSGLRLPKFMFRELNEE